MPRQVGEGIGRVRERFRQGPFQGGFVKVSALVEAFQQAVAFLQQLVTSLAGMYGGGGVWKDGKGGGFRPGEFGGGPAKVSPRRRLKAYHIASKGGVGGI